MDLQSFNIFKKGSRTYFYSSLFFPRVVRNDIFDLYAFVRTIDDFVDQIPQNINGFNSFVSSYYQEISNREAANEIIKRFVRVQNAHKIDQTYIDAFINSMKQDLHKKRYSVLADTEQYIYGSAEVIGVMMAKVLNLPAQSYESAQRLGKSMQYLNFLRDINEDITLDRIYFPTEDLQKFNLEHLSVDYVKTKPEEFKGFINFQLNRYKKWQKEAEKGFSYLPARYLIPIKTASDMYIWVAQRIEKDPYIIYSVKLKPSVFRILLTILKNTFHAKIAK